MLQNVQSLAIVNSFRWNDTLIFGFQIWMTYYKFIVMSNLSVLVLSHFYKLFEWF